MINKFSEITVNVRGKSMFVTHTCNPGREHADSVRYHSGTVTMVDNTCSNCGKEVSPEIRFMLNLRYFNLK